MPDDATICAIATAPGQGAIALIRLSGQDAISITDHLFRSVRPQKKLHKQAANTIHFGMLYAKNELIDEVLVSLFRAPHSYTGEDLVEISCHGSVYIQQNILRLLVENGARLAEPGEFTMRAFLNGKMDLSRAEAVADLIASSSSAAHRVAIGQMRGGISQAINDLRKRLLKFASLIELELDFSEEDVEFADRQALRDLLSEIKQHIAKLIKSFELGNAIKNGVPVTIVGEPNVGKSTLLNALLGDKRAIVSDIPGTTRDTVEDSLVVDGINFRFIDTAGLRDTQDTIELLGIQKTFEKIQQARIVLLLLDAQSTMEAMQSQTDHLYQKLSEHTRLIVVINKADISEVADKVNSLIVRDKDQKLMLSAKTGKNLDQLFTLLSNTINLSTLESGDPVLSNVRHYNILQDAQAHLSAAFKALQDNIPTDLLAQDVRQTINILGSITGSISTEDVLGEIFEKFCIGK